MRVTETPEEPESSLLVMTKSTRRSMFFDSTASGIPCWLMNSFALVGAEARAESASNSRAVVGAVGGRSVVGSEGM